MTLATTPTSDRERVCKGCGGVIPPTRAKQARHCSPLCAKRTNARRERSRASCKEYRRNYQSRRLKEDPAFRAEKDRRVREWRQVRTYGTVLRTPEDIILHAKDKYRRAPAAGYRSGLEVRIARQLEEAGYPVDYETLKVKYTVPARIATYSPDFPMSWNGIIVESKGVFVTADRQKHLLIKNDHPDLDIRFVFSNPNARISKQSSTTYAKWCDKHGFQYAKQLIPVSWMKEKPESKRMQAMRECLGIK